MVPADGDARESRQLEAAREDPEQFAPIFERYVELIYRYCIVRLWNREQAEDATSQTFLRALSALADYRGGSVRAWLFAIARSTVIDLQRRRLLESSSPGWTTSTDNQRSPEAELLEHEDVRWLHASMQQLTGAQRQVVALRLAGLSAVEIAVSTGRSPGSVRALQFRALAELKRLHELEDLKGARDA